MSRAIACAVAVLLVLAGCANEQDPGGDQRARQSFEDCGAPPPDENLREGLVPDEFVLPEAQLTQARKRKGGFLAALNVPLGVDEAYQRYLEVVKNQDFQITSHETEGFEAEVFFTKRQLVGAIQIRMTSCTDVSFAFVQIVDRRSLG